MKVQREKRTRSKKDCWVIGLHGVSDRVLSKVTEQETNRIRKIAQEQLKGRA